MAKCKNKSPCFVKVKLMKNGEAELIDDDGERWHVQMRRDQAWPMLSRTTRNLEMREADEKFRQRKSVPVPPGPPMTFGPPRLVS